MNTATIAGATGLIGNELMHLLLNDNNCATVRILLLKPISFDHPKLAKKLVDFADADSLLVAMDGSNAVFCCVGTTQKKVKGDKDAYRKVDFDIPVNLARYCKIIDCKKIVIVSAAGANSKAGNFYLKLKGEMEEAVKASGVESIHIMRPSVLLGNRNESRPMEKISQKIMSALSFLIPSKYKPISATDVARAMIAAAAKNETGFFVYEYAGMREVISEK